MPRHCSRVSRVTVTEPSGVISPFSTAISKVFSAVRASPSAKAAITGSRDGSMWTRALPKLRLSASARDSSPTRSSSVSSFSTNTLHRESRAALISKEGFSVVAPINVMLPRST